MSRRWLFLIAAGVAAGCAAITGVGDLIETPGDADAAFLDARAGDASSADGDASDAGPPRCAVLATCGGDAGAPGFAPVAFDTRTTPCPAGYAELDLVKDPVVDGGACSCGACNVTTPPACDGGPLQTYYDDLNVPKCDQLGAAFLYPNVCRQVPVLFGHHAKVTPPTAVGGSCVAPASQNLLQVSSTKIRACVPCAGSSCVAPPPFSSCWIANGDRPCAPGLTKQLAGETLDVTCPACGCSVAGQCGGTLTSYGDPNCAQLAGTLNIDGTCVPTDAGVNAESYLWQPSVAAATCAASPPADASPSIVLANIVTICCP